MIGIDKAKLKDSTLCIRLAVVTSAEQYAVNLTLEVYQIIN